MNIVFAPALAPAAWAVGQSLLPEGFTIEVLDKEPRRRIEQLERADFLMGLLRDKLTALDYEHLRKVKLVQLFSSGHDGLDLDKFRRLGLTVCNNGGANAYAVAEHAIALMLAVYRQIPEMDRVVRAGGWKSSKPGDDEAHEIAGKTVGIVGAGVIGRTVARRLSGFEVTLLYHDPVPLAPDVAAQLNMRYRELDDLLREADIVTLHAPGTPATRHMICERTLALMKPGAIIINTARGELIDEAALCRALKERRVWAAGLDSFEQEPPDPANPLFALPNVVLSPHVGGPTWEGWPKRFANGYANLQRVARGEPPLWVIADLRQG